MVPGNKTALRTGTMMSASCGREDMTSGVAGAISPSGDSS
jgi:hypothetical protein